MSELKARRYHHLIIKASPQTDIWLADDDGHLVQKERGVLNTSLLPGAYVVEFGLGTQTYPIHLRKDSEYSQDEIEAGPPCPRPEVKLAPRYTAKQGQYLAFISTSQKFIANRHLLPALAPQLHLAGGVWISPHCGNRPCAA